MTTPPGGPSTINGVLYQMLWSLLRAGKVTVAAVECNDKDITGVTLVLEPRAGGDLRVLEDSIIVEQVKTRSDEGPWSLRQIVEGVLPDLYLAARDPAVGTRYSFVTDGHMGRWSSVAKFFESLAEREINADDPLSCLDDTKAIPFQTSKKKSTAQPFWYDKPYTERRIVERIVEEVRKREKVRNEALVVTQSNALKMLGALDFKWGQSTSLLQNELDACLAAVVNHSERRSVICRSLAMALAQLATQGEAAIEPVAFFKSHGLDAVPLSNWAAIRRRATHVLDRELRLRRYDYQADVRADGADEITKLWNYGTPLVVLSGETGFGKSWQLYALADRLRQSPALPLYIEARGNAEQTLGFAGQLFSEEVWGVDNPLSLARISERRKEFHPNTLWLTLIIDNVQSVEEAKQLGLKPWEDWGIRVAIGCHPRIADVVKQSAAKRASAATVGIFSIEETHRFLEYSLPMGWSRIPQDIIEMLRRPLLAHLYVDAVADQSWSPVNEYELYDAHWRRIHQGSGSQNPLDEARLKALVRAFLDGKQYPWTDSQLLEAGVDDEAFDRLYLSGWMVRSADGEFAVPHDRLLNWAVAVTLVEDLEQERSDVTALGDKLRTLSFGDATVSGRYLGYSAMDVVWLVANNARLSGNLATLIPLLEVHHVQTEDLYKELLPTIGPPIVDSLFELLRQRSALLYFQKQLIDGLCKLGGATVDAEVFKLLNSGIPRLQRYSFIFLAEQPAVSALPTLWKLHQGILADPAPWLEENDSKYMLRDECFAALRACCRLSPSWLAEVAASADPALEPCSELAYLIANLPFSSGRATWQQAKSDLMKKVPKEKHRAIASCMLHFPDAADKPWLVERLPNPHDHIGLACLQAICRIDPKSGIESLHLVSRRNLALGRNWWFPELAVHDAAAVGRKLREMMRDAEGPWDIAICYEGYEHVLEPELLELLLDQLVQDLEGCVGKSAADRDRLYRQLTQLTSMNTLGQLESIRKRQGTALEANLEKFLGEIGARKHEASDSLVRDPAMEILYRIGGSSFTSVANDFIASESQYGRREGMEYAIKRPDDSTFDLCTTHVLSDDTWSGGKSPLEQNDAATILASGHKWTSLVPFFEKWWPNIYTSLTDPLEADEPLPDSIRVEIRERVLSAGVDCNAGSIDLLGFSRIVEDIPIIRDLLSKIDPETDLATACLLAIHRLDDHAAESVPVLERFLVGTSARLARIALTVNGSGPAYAALLKHYESDFELALAINLLNHASTAERAVELTKQHLANLNMLFWSNELEELLTHIHDQNICEQLLGVQDVRDRVFSRIFAKEGRSWIGGSKAAAIRAVSIVDRPRAIQAAVAVLSDPDAHDRDRYPYLLVDLAEEGAAVLLLDLLGKEPSKAIQASIARALATLDCSTELRKRLQSENSQARVSACRAIGYGAQGKSLSEELTKLLECGENEIVDAATMAVLRLRTLEHAEEIKKRIKGCSTDQERWIYLDALLALADPGDQHCKLPVWATEIWDSLTPYMRQHAIEQLKKRRKDLFQKLSKRK